MNQDKSIINYRQLSDMLGTAGQPTREQFAAIANAGFQVVINLAMPASTNTLHHESELVSAQGMEYHHIPVVWEAPQKEDLQKFFALMDQNHERKILVHCALNMRVSCFVYLYRVLRLVYPSVSAWQDVLAIWTPNPVWQRFVDQMLARDAV